jgi:uncharacterized RDD family membrane protein YckC
MYKTLGRVPAGATINAGFWRRCAAYLIDSAILLALAWSIVVGLAFGLSLVGLHDATTVRVVSYGVIGAIYWLYYSLQESSAAQASLGKRAFGLKIVDERCDRIGFGRATFRFFGKILSGLILGIGFLMAGMTARKQALHDLFAGTFVVFRPVNPGEPIPDARPPMPWYGWVLNGALLAYPVVDAAVTFPAYNNYTTRSQVVEGMVAGDVAKTALADFYADKNRCPVSGAEAGLDAAAAMSLPYVDNVKVEPDCVIVITFAASNAVGSSLRGQRIEMIGRPDAHGVLGWTCGGTLAPQLLPQSCRR